MKRVVVIGGGVIGITSAVALARRGHQVTLLERLEQPGSGASARNGGQLSYAYADALAAPGIIGDIPRLLAGLDPAFRIRIRLNPAFLGWMMNFLANCSTHRFESNTRAVLNLALLSQTALASIRAEYPELSFQHGSTGKMHIFVDATKWKAAVLVVQKKAGWGVVQQVLSPSEAIALEPALANTTRPFICAIYTASDEAGDAQLFARAMAAIAVQKYGVSIHTETTATGFDSDGRVVRAVLSNRGAISGDVFVVAAGSDAANLARTVGVNLPILPMKGYSITLPATSHSPAVSVTDTAAKIVFCRLGDTMRIAGMAELGYADTAVDSRKIGELIAAARRCLPMAADWGANPGAWAGLRPMTPDSRPIIGNTALSNLLLNCGHGMLGWTLACGSAELVAAAVAGEQVPMAGEFQLGRFSRLSGRSRILATTRTMSR